MGVLGLWQLLAPVGQPVSLESLENKVLAVDISIWLNQAIKGYRNSQGDSVPNAHLLSLFTRLCKLLFYRIRPIIVFDGGVPELKKQTVAMRQQRRDILRHKGREAGLKVLANYLLNQTLNKTHNTASKYSVPRSEPPLKDDIFQLAPISDDPESETDDPLNSRIKTAHSFLSKAEQKYLNKIDIDSEEFHSLPPDIKQEILVSLKESKRHRTWEEYEDLPDDSCDFSQYQMQNLLKRRNLQKKIEEVQSELRKTSSADILALYNGEDHVLGETSKIISEDYCHYILLKKNTKEPEEISISESNVKPQLEKDKPFRICDEVHTENSDENKSLRDSAPNNAFHDEQDNCFKLASVTESSCHVPKPLVNVSDVTSVSFREDTLDHIGKNDTLDHIEMITSKNISHENIVFKRKFSSISEDKGQDSTDVLKIIPNMSNSSSPKSFTLNFKDNVHISPINSTSGKIVTSDQQANAEFLNVTSVNCHEGSVHLSHSENKKILLKSDTMKCSNAESECNENKKIYSAELMKSSKESLAVVNDMLMIADKVNAPCEAFVTNLETERRIILSSCNSSAPVSYQKKLLSNEISENVHEIHSKIILTDKNLIQNNNLTIPELNAVEERKTATINTNFFEDGASTSTTNLDSENQPFSSADEKDHMNETSSSVEDSYNVFSALQEEFCINSAALRAEQAKQLRQARSVQDHMYEECQELLQLFGIPYIVSPMEAEAQCAFFDSENVTNGTITDDSDVWLFGGKKVYKNFFAQKKYVEFYKVSEILSHFGLSRRKLINFALLTGSDYTEGIDGVGHVTALEIISEFNDDGIEALLKFKEWWELSRKHSSPPKNKIRSKLLKVNLNSNFPSQKVFEAYFNPTIDDSKEIFSWGRPDLDALRDYTAEKFGWNKGKVDNILLPVIKRLNEKSSQTHLENFFSVGLRKEKELFPSKRIMSALKKINPSAKNSKKDNIMDKNHETQRKKAKKSSCKSSNKAVKNRKLPASKTKVPAEKNFQGKSVKNILMLSEDSSSDGI